MIRFLPPFVEMGVKWGTLFTFAVMKKTVTMAKSSEARPNSFLFRVKGSNLCAALNAAYLTGESPVPGIAYLPG
jgi:hypothetical protein